MRVKYLLLCALLSFGACDKGSTPKLSLEQKTQTIQKALDEKNLPFKVVEITDIGHSLDLVVVQSNDGTQEALLSTSDSEVLMVLDGIAFSADEKLVDTISSKTQSITKANKQMTDSVVKEVLQKYKDRAIHFSAKSPTTKRLIVISDPSCMYCAKELAGLDERLEQYNVDMYIVALLGPDSITRASYIMEHRSSDENANKTLLQNVYDKKFSVGKEAESVAKDVVEFSGVLIESGVRSVPYIIEIE